MGVMQVVTNASIKKIQSPLPVHGQGPLGELGGARLGYVASRLPAGIECLFFRVKPSRVKLLPMAYGRGPDQNAVF